MRSSLFFSGSEFHLGVEPNSLPGGARKRDLDAYTWELHATLVPFVDSCTFCEGGLCWAAKMSVLVGQSWLGDQTLNLGPLLSFLISLRSLPWDVLFKKI